jgi:sodium-coupled monocarboxylate transporter 8/12
MNETFEASSSLFTSFDYGILISSLLISTVIGLAHGVKFSSRGCTFGKSTDEYFLASGNLGLVPVTLSLVASSISPMTMLGLPVEVYSHGFSIWFFVIGEFLGCVLAALFCIPIFFTLKFNR